jgi:AbrB family looped-hinge helix DNA binding protein
MNTSVTLDKAGRVVIPKTVRDELHLEPGDRLALALEGELVMLRPVRSSTPLRKERGVWVFRTSRKLPAAVTDKVLRDVRDQRAGQNRGESA